MKSKDQDLAAAKLALERLSAAVSSYDRNYYAANSHYTFCHFRLKKVLCLKMRNERNEQWKEKYQKWKKSLR